MSTNVIVAQPNSPFKVFGRDPILWLEGIKQGLALLAVLLPGISPALQVAIVAVVQGGFTVLQALSARPIVPTLFAGLIQAVATLLVLLNVSLPDSTVVTIQTFVAGVITLALTNRTTPVVSPVSADGAYQITVANPPASQAPLAGGTDATGDVNPTRGS
jgi:hypothetical protein